MLLRLKVAIVGHIVHITRISCIENNESKHYTLFTLHMSTVSVPSSYNLII